MDAKDFGFPEHWGVKTLVELTQPKNVSYGIVQPGKHEPNGVPIIRVNNFTTNGVDVSDVLRVAPEIEKKFAKTKLKKADVLLTLVGSTGQTYVVPEKYEGWNVPRAVAVIRPDDTVSPNWIKICLDSNFTKHFLDSRANTTVQKTLNLSDVKKIPIPIPPKQEREFIERSAVNLSNKISLNFETNQTLEKIAQELFKSWFVDFDPVIDNALAAGNVIPDELQVRVGLRKSVQQSPDVKPLLESIRQLFPSEFEESELGWIPKGWGIKALGETIDLIETGRRPKGGVSKYKTGIPSVGAESIRGVGNFEYGKTKFVPEEFFLKMKKGKVKDFDVLLYKDGGKPGDFKPRIGMFGKGFPFEEFGINEHVFRLRSSTLGQFFLYCQLGSQRIFHELSVRGGKAAIPGVNQEEVKSQLLLVPNNNQILEEFNEIVGSNFESILMKSLVNKNLEKIRDVMLPKLISGELTVPGECSTKWEGGRALKGTL